MKPVLSTLLTLSIFAAPAWAITVTTPASGAHVASPFSLVASTATCDSKAALSMGYSIDSGPTTITPITFRAMVSADQGAHILHVKCWGQGVNEEQNLDITIAAATAVTVQTPTAGETVASPFSVSATAALCSSAPVSAMGYSLDSSSNTIIVNAQLLKATVVTSTGEHTLHVKAWSAGNSCVTDVALTVSSTTAAAPVFSPAAGTYTSTQSVRLSDATAGATIYYTSNGTAPSTSSARYSGPISVGVSADIEAIAVVSGFDNSGLAKAAYVIKAPSSGPVVPSNAIVASNVHLLDTWHFNHDAGTPGTAVGAMNLVSTPSRSGSARQFNSSYTGSGGEIYSVDFGEDTASMNFVYDAWVWIDAGSSISNLEMDSNQVTANGQTVIYAFQCSGYTKTWEYSGAGAKWVSSTQPCNVEVWQTDVWHHVQISYSRDTSGNVTYKSVWLDGAEQSINATVPSTFALGWKMGVVQTQFQIDGLGASGHNTVYVDDLTISRW